MNFEKPNKNIENRLEVYGLISKNLEELHTETSGEFIHFFINGLNFVSYHYEMNAVMVTDPTQIINEPITENQMAKVKNLIFDLIRYNRDQIVFFNNEIIKSFKSEEETNLIKDWFSSKIAFKEYKEKNPELFI